MTARYTKAPEQRKAAECLMEKLRSLSDVECMDMVRNIQKNYRLLQTGRTIAELIAEARQKSGAEKLKGHEHHGAGTLCPRGKAHEHPPIVIHEEDRKGYYTALEAWNVRQDLKPLGAFLREQTEKTWKKQIARTGYLK